MDAELIRQGVRMILEGIGEDPDREGLLDTPDRIARMAEEIFGGLAQDAADHLSRTFAVDERDGMPAGEMVIEKDIPFYSTCEHHLLPFFGTVNIAYLPGDRVVGLSKLARTVEVFARRPQIQERMNAQIAQAILDNMGAKGVLVTISAEHMCMSMRGVKKPGAKTVTSVMLGEFRENQQLADRALMMMR